MAPLALGTAFHSVLAANFRRKIATKQDLPAKALEGSFGEALAMAAEAAEFREDEEPAADGAGGDADGIYLPRRGSPLGSRRYCGYWRECEREFGGRVEE